MASAGPNYPGTASEAAYGIYFWEGTTEQNIKAYDAQYATSWGLVIFGDSMSYYLDGTNYGFSVPSGATINGILLEVRAGNLGGGGRDAWVRFDEAKLMLNGIQKGSDKGPIAMLENGAVTDYQMGGPSDLWGTSWTPANINDSTFGSRIAMNFHPTRDISADVDFHRITVYYTPSGGGVKFCSVACSKFNGVTVSKFDGVA